MTAVPGDGTLPGSHSAALVSVPVQDLSGCWLRQPADPAAGATLGEHGCVGGVWREPMLPGDQFPNESTGERVREKLSRPSVFALHALSPEGL